MLSCAHIGTCDASGARTRLGEVYGATPLGARHGSHPLTLNLPRRRADDYHLPKAPSNDGLSDDLHAARTVTTSSQSQGLLVCGMRCELNERKGRCVAAGCKTLSTKQTDFGHMRGECGDSLPRAHRDLCCMWRPDSAG